MQHGHDSSPGQPGQHTGAVLQFLWQADLHGGASHNVFVYHSTESERDLLPDNPWAETGVIA